VRNLNTGSMLVERDKKVLVGTGQHKRLIVKRRSLDLRGANEAYSVLIHSFGDFGNPNCLFWLSQPVHMKQAFKNILKSPQLQN